MLHDAGNDVRALAKDHGWTVTRIFDTRIAAQILGVKAFGLASLLAEHFNLKLDKKFQRADWSMRPLTAPMLAYAEQDTAHLLALRDRLRAELGRVGRLAWAEEEFTALEQPAVDDDEERTAPFLRIKGARELSPRGLTCLRELVDWREAISRSRDKAPFRVIGNEQLLAMCNDPPGALSDSSRIHGANPSLLKERGQELVDIVARVRALDDKELAAFPRGNHTRDPVADARIAKIKGVRDATAEKLDIDPGFLCGRSRLEAIVSKRPRSLDELAAVEGVRRWHVDVMGSAPLAALA